MYLHFYFSHCFISVIRKFGYFVTVDIILFIILATVTKMTFRTVKGAHMESVMLANET